VNTRTVSVTYHFVDDSSTKTSKRRRHTAARAAPAPAAAPLTWTGDVSSYSSKDADFKVTSSLGPRNIPASLDSEGQPYDFLKLFWTDDVWQVIVDNTNLQATYIKEEKPSNYCARGFQPVTIDEMKAFFGCRIAIEMLLHKDRYEQYWRSKDSWLTRTPGFSQVFTRDRFLAIWSLLHCVDERDVTVDKTDKIYKTRPIVNYLIEKFQFYYIPECELSLDDGMIPTKNSLSMKQYIKDKPIKWGIKTFILCESKTGYILNAEVYTGKSPSDTTFIEELGVTGSLVVRLSQPFHDLNYCLFTDRFYTSVTLAQYLLDNCGTRICGTALTNRKLFPKTLIRKKMTRGTSERMYNGSVGALVWCDKRPIYFVATKYVDSAEDTVLRYSAQEHKRLPVSCPMAAKAYNSYMGGTDRNDQLTKLCRIRRHYKWPRRLVVKFFMWATYNAYVIHGYLVPHNQPGRRNITFHAFIDKLCHDLIGSYRRTSVTRRSIDALVDNRLLNSGPTPQHLVERAAKASSNNRCAVCSEKYNRAKRQDPKAREADLPKRSKTVYRCCTCKVYLCVGTGDDNCFAAYHSRKEYWR